MNHKRAPRAHFTETLPLADVTISALLLWFTVVLRSSLPLRLQIVGSLWLVPTSLKLLFASPLSVASTL